MVPIAKPTPPLQVTGRDSPGALAARPTEDHGEVMRTRGVRSPRRRPNGSTEGRDALDDAPDALDDIQMMPRMAMRHDERVVICHGTGACRIVVVCRCFLIPTT